MHNHNETYVDHEVRIRILEKIAEKIDSRFEAIDRKFDQFENKLNNHFYWTMGTLVVMFLTTISIFAPVIFHLAKLT